MKLKSRGVQSWSCFSVCHSLSNGVLSDKPQAKPRCVNCSWTANQNTDVHLPANHSVCWCWSRRLNYCLFSFVVWTKCWQKVCVDSMISVCVGLSHTVNRCFDWSKQKSRPTATLEWRYLVIWVTHTYAHVDTPLPGTKVINNTVDYDFCSLSHALTHTLTLTELICYLKSHVYPVETHILSR